MLQGAGRAEKFPISLGFYPRFASALHPFNQLKNVHECHKPNPNGI